MANLKKKFTDAMIAEALAKHGGNADSAAVELGCTPPTVYAYKRRNGMGTGKVGRPLRFTDDLILAAMTETGGALRDVMATLRCSDTTIYRYFAKLRAAA
jgi:DNA-binding NtrC family response regulator